MSGSWRVHTRCICGHLVFRHDDQDRCYARVTKIRRCDCREVRPRPAPMPVIVIGWDPGAA